MNRGQYEPLEDTLSEVARHYYRLLNDEADFRAGLARLFERLGGLGLTENDAYNLSFVAQDYAVKGELEMSRWAREQAAAKLDEGSPRLVREASALDTLADFIDSWPLPLDGLHDLLLSYAGRKLYGLILRVGSRSGFAPTVGLRVEVDTFKLASGKAVRRVEFWPWVLPNLPLAFLYDPREQNRQWLHEQIEAICGSIRESILAQAEEYERQAKTGGWRTTPPNYGDSKRLDLYARRLYLRAVKHWTWQSIAEDERPAVHYTSVQQQTTRLAQNLGLRLP